MNTTTIGNNIPSSSNWKRIKGQYLAVAAGVALALTAVAALSSGADRTAKVQDFAGRPSVSVAATLGVDTPHSYFFIVADEAQKAQLDAANNELRALDPTRNDINVLVAGSPAAVSLQGEGARELMANGVAFTVSDMTVAPEQARAVVSRTAAETERSVVTTALEQYELQLTTEQSSVAEPAYVMAGVISTELAYFGN